MTSLTSRCYTKNMKANARQLGASEFKTRCLGILDEIAETGVPVTITKHGKPIAEVVPIRSKARKSYFGGWEHLIQVKGDIVSPIDVEWDAMK